MPRLLTCVSSLLLVVAAGLGSAQQVSITVQREIEVQYQNTSIAGLELLLVDNGTEHKLFRFLSIGYAQPPVGQLRFAEPQPLSFSDELLMMNATGLPPACPTAGDKLNESSRYSEDCLYLSIRASDLGRSSPVLILLASSEVGVTDGDAFGAISDVVIATIQSRQSVLGYLKFNGVPENLGLRDQQLAIRFLDDAVASFGGDRTRVTLAGHGDAAAAAGLLAVLAGASFGRVAMLGGSIASPLAWTNSLAGAGNLGLQLVRHLDCQRASSGESLDCLRGLSSEELLQSAALLSPDAFVPLGAGELFPNGTDDPLERWRAGAFAGALLTGATVSPGAATAQAALKGLQWDQVNQSVFDSVIDREFAYYPRLHAESTNCARDFLRVSLADWPDRRFGTAVRPLLTEAIGDYRYTCPVWQATGDLLGASVGPAYVYLVNVTGLDGQEHAADAWYFLGEPLVRDGYSESHGYLARRMMAELALFVKQEDLDTTWPGVRATGSEFRYFKAENDSFSLGNRDEGFGLEPGRCPMWKHELPFHSAQCESDSADFAARAEPAPVSAEHGESVWAAKLAAAPRPRTLDYTVLRDFQINAVGLGNIVGQTIQTGANVTMSQFLGLPYAQPPLGDLRFANPVAKGNLGNFEAKQMPLPCMQRSEYAQNMSEDCLYLNIWTPISSDNSESNIPVIVFLHGGFFQFDSIAAWRGHWMLNHAKVVLVTVAYRLGAFGFLSLDDASVPGNFGLRDQELALAWVRQHIHRFGGHRTRITVMGVEAGAVSVSYHLTRSKDYFHQAVILTGSAYMNYPISNDTSSVRLINRIFTEDVLNCDSLACLRSLNASFINDKTRDFNRLYPGIEFPPVIDGDFIRSDPLAMDASQFAKLPIVVGGVDGPGNSLVERLRIGENFTHELFLKELLESIAHYPRFPLEPSGRVKKALELHYTDYNGRNNSIRDSEVLARAISSRQFICANQRFLDEISVDDSRPVYHFRFEEKFGSVDLPLPGAYLFYDAFYALGFPTSATMPHSRERIELSKTLVKSIVDFASTGQPSWARPWPRYHRNRRATLTMRAGSLDQLEPTAEVFTNRDCNFWESVLPCVMTGNCFPPPQSTPGATATTEEGISQTTEPTGFTETISEATKDSTTTASDILPGSSTSSDFTRGSTVTSSDVPPESSTSSSEVTPGSSTSSSEVTPESSTSSSEVTPGSSTSSSEVTPGSSTSSSEVTPGSTTTVTETVTKPTDAKTPPTDTATTITTTSTTTVTTAADPTTTRPPIGPEPAFIAVAVAVPIVSVGIIGSTVFIIVKLAFQGPTVSPV